ncbi:MAG: DUF1549 and DUF1553 domain-containing protein [Fuerstiella sp.]|nr:DUF1549 and DUF1553 domain-containing protein [Fuerstiella sp.]
MQKPMRHFECRIPDQAVVPIAPVFRVHRGFCVPQQFQRHVRSWKIFSLVLSVTVLLCSTHLVTHASEPLPSVGSSRPVYFATDVVPILTKLGCNGGGCHGKATGQNGFKLSLFGFDPEFDHQAIVQAARGRRLLPASPEHSLLMMKATSETPHGGGQRLEKSSEDYDVLLAWIAQGAAKPKSDDPQLVRIELASPVKTLRAESLIQLNVTAFFSDGTSRDVTRQTVYESNQPDVATVDSSGLVSTTSQSGLVSVMARFGEKIVTFDAALPFARSDSEMAAVQKQLDVLEQKFSNSEIDRLLLQQWRRMGVVPSTPADDATMIRRLTIDICGTLPTKDEVTEYLNDDRPDKRNRLVNRLLARPEYSSYFALKWADILQNRGAGYSTSKQRPGTTLFGAWIRDSIAANKPYDQFVAEIIAASGSQNENPPTIWYRTVRKTPEYVESVAQAFLGVRIQCAQCHNHPTERWTQSDYYGLAAVFSRVGRKGGFADAEVPTNEIIYVKSHGTMKHPRSGELLSPKPLGAAAFEADGFSDPRVHLARWMTGPDNPFFARTMVNRIWAHFLSRGIVHPIDDARSTNPPSNPELLDALSDGFIASGFDVKQLIRTITGCYVYLLDSSPNEGNAGDVQSFARFYPRRMTAEVLLDGISQALEVPTSFPGMPAGIRAIDLPDENVAAHFLDVFGRPSRMSACECERVDSPSLAQALELVNSTEIQRKLTAEPGYASQLASGELTTEDVVTDCFLTMLARYPLASEREAAVSFIDSQEDRPTACRDLLWSLLATNEFLLNH